MSSFIECCAPAVGDPQLGTWVKLPSLETVEILALCGYDFIVIDGEHSPLTLESVYRSVALGQALGMQVLVRVADRSGETVQRILDSGADGILTPQVADAAVAEEVTRRMVFSSDGGTRGMGATSRAGWWGLATAVEYLEHGRTQLARVVQLESAEALARVDEILDVPTVNAALIGLGDLTLSTGRRASDPVIRQMVAAFVAAGHERGLPCGTAVANAEAAVAAIDDGFDFVLVGNDASLFAAAAKSQLDHVRERVGIA
ncbi:MAG TPA: aldolase/citrate lyase family protein [Solirubrobacter sp.]|nr:aldolase/citrate lyase family protein [Solirubrobacter sp.]